MTIRHLDVSAPHRTEKSTNQVIRPVNSNALSNWVGSIPGDVLREMPQIAPMLATLGYDPLANPPLYGVPDQDVANNTVHIRNNPQIWIQKERDILKMLNVQAMAVNGT